MAILLTGGAGYIGSHTCVELLARGEQVVVLDNLSNCSLDVIRRIESIAGVAVAAVVGDVRDRELLDGMFRQYPIDAVIHFAGLKAVGESTREPLRYYENNVLGTVVLLQAMQQANVSMLVFSSSATVYGEPQRLPLTEDHPLSATNPYGRTKLMIEEILRDMAATDPRWHFALLRYFNPVGAHESGLIGEDPVGVPNNLMPFVARVAAGIYPQLDVFGGDYPTTDGTGVRDYIHVVDLARGHVAALARLRQDAGVLTVNLGTGRGHSVLEIVSTFEKVCGVGVPYRIVGRRPGDVAACYADVHRASALLDWRSTLDLTRMCIDTWRWQRRHSTSPA
jgi:UDP-glucose 4-epimerase